MSKRDAGLLLVVLGLILMATAAFMVQVQSSPGVTGGLAGTGTMTSLTFTGDGVVLSNTPSAAITTAGTVAATLATAAAGSILNNGTAAAAAPGYTQTPTLGAVGGSSGSITYLGSVSGTASLGCVGTNCGSWGSATVPATFKSFTTGTNCAGVGTAAQPSVVTCATAAAGRVACSTSATTSCQVNTTAVTANSNIIVIQTQNTAVGTALSVTCNTTTSTIVPLVLSQVAGTSFTFQLTQPVTNPDCFTYLIVD